MARRVGRPPLHLLLLLIIENLPTNRGGIFRHRKNRRPPKTETDFFIDNLLVRIHFIIKMIRWTGLAPWEFEFPFPGPYIYRPSPEDTHSDRTNLMRKSNQLKTLVCSLRGKFALG